MTMQAPRSTQSTAGLHHRRDVRRTMHAVRPPTCTRQNAGVRQNKDVSGQDIVERQNCGKETGHQQNLNQMGCHRSGKVSGSGDQHAVGIGARNVHCTLVAPRRHDRPTGESIEAADEDQGGVCRSRDSPRGILRLIAEDRRRLEPDVAGKREYQCDTGGSGENFRRREHCRRRTFRTTVGDDESVEYDNDPDLCDQQDAEHLARQFDMTKSKDGYQSQRGEREDPPRHFRTTVGGDQRTHCRAEVAVHRQLHCAVTDKRQHRTADTGTTAETMSDVEIERAGSRDVTRHRGESDGEEQKYTGGHGEGHGEARTVATGNAQRHKPTDHSQRSGRGNDHEDYRTGTQRAS